MQILEITQNQAGQRIDNFLLKTIKKLPKSRLYRIIRKGEVRVNKKRIKPEYKLQCGDLLRIPPIRLQHDESRPIVIPADLMQKLNNSVLFENNEVLIINKPHGLAVHSGSGLRYGVIDIMRKLRPDNDIELVHRLDRDTSGCLILTKSRASLLVMQRLLQSNEMRKNYVAVVKGHWNSSLTSIELPLLRQTMSNGEKRVFVDERGQASHTCIDNVRHIKQDGICLSMLDIHLLSGRTHQIRVHCQSQKHEIGGDPKYGDRPFNQQLKSLGIRRMLLHAVSLEIPRNAHTKALKIIAPIPKEFRKLVQDEE